MIRAYSEDYLVSAQKIMGDMFDYAGNTCQLCLDDFFDMFVVSDIAYQFQTGNPAYIAGKNGCEIAKEVIEKSGLGRIELPDEMHLDKSPEYWSGWALAYYQWYTCKPFRRIRKAISVGEILKMYPVFHEMDIMQFVEAMDKKFKKYYMETNLKRIRINAGLTQAELAELSEVPVRQIQLFEQRQRDINHTKAINVMRLGQILGCRMEDLLEI